MLFGGFLEAPCDMPLDLPPLKLIIFSIIVGNGEEEKSNPFCSTNDYSIFCSPFLVFLGPIFCQDQAPPAPLTRDSQSPPLMPHINSSPRKDSLSFSPSPNSVCKNFVFHQTPFVFSVFPPPPPSPDSRLGGFWRGSRLLLAMGKPISPLCLASCMRVLGSSLRGFHAPLPEGAYVESYGGCFEAI